MREAGIPTQNAEANPKPTESTAMKTPTDARPRRGSVLLLLVPLLGLLVFGCAGNQAMKRADREGVLGNWDAAVTYYQQVLQEDPENVEAKIKLARAKTKASQMHQKNGRELREKGELEQALMEYELAVRLDSANEVAASELRKVRAEFAAEQRARREEKTPTEEAVERSRKERLPIPELEPKVSGPFSLDFPRAPAREIYRALARIAGINVIFDSAVGDETTSFTVEDVNFDEALRILTSSLGHFAKPLSSNTLLIAPDNATKRRQYADQVMKTFYLSNAAAEDVAQMLRALFQTRSLAENADLNSITIRDTPEVIDIAEKLVASIDKPMGEVLLDVEILEVNRRLIRDYGLSLSQYGIGGSIGEPDAAGNTRISLEELEGLTNADQFLTIPSVFYQFLKDTNDFKLIANPQLRASVGQETSLLVGQRVPVVTTTFNPQSTVGGNVVPISSTAYEDVGIVIAAQARVHHNREISLDLDVEVSSVISQTIVQQTELPVFSTRTLSTTIRLRDGETNLLAGLLRDDERLQGTGLPGLSEVPILRNLFGNTRREVQQTDILLSITPHILRTPEIGDEDLRAIYVGTEGNVGGGGFGGTSRGAAGRFGRTSRAPGAAGEAEEGAPVFVSLEPRDHVVQVGDELSLDVVLDGAEDLFSAGLRLQFDSSVIEYVGGEEGEMMARDGAEVMFQTAAAGAGGVAIGMSRVGDVGGVAGGGVLASLVFRAVGPGETTIEIGSAAIRTPEGEPLAAELQGADVTVSE